MSKRYKQSNDSIDMTPRYAPTEVTLSGRRAPVIRYIVHPPGTHRGVITPDMTALELVTDRGSRWYGVEDAYINSELKMVVVGTDRRDEVRMAWKVVPKNKR